MISLFDDFSYPSWIILRGGIVWESLLFDLLPLGYPNKVRVGEIKRSPSPSELGQRAQKRLEHVKGSRTTLSRQFVNGRDSEINLNMCRLGGLTDVLVGDARGDVEYHQVR